MVILFKAVQEGDDWLTMIQAQVKDKIVKQRPIANFGKRKEDATSFSEWCFDHYYNTTYGRDRILKWVKKCDPKKKMKLVMICNRAFIEEQ